MFPFFFFGHAKPNSCPLINRAILPLIHSGPSLSRNKSIPSGTKAQSPSKAGTHK